MPSQYKTSKKYIPVEEYLQQEELSQVKHEYRRGMIVEMPGAKYEHNLVAANLSAVIWNKLSETDCKILSNDMKIHIPSHNSVLYPDLSILCGEPEFFQDRRDVLTNPNVLIEVLSESTQAYDRGDKFEKYASIDSFQEYILIAQDRPFVEIFFLVKKEEDLWKINRYYDLEDIVKVHSLGIEFQLKEAYKRVSLN